MFFDINEKDLLPKGRMLPDVEPLDDPDIEEEKDHRNFVRTVVGHVLGWAYLGVFATLIGSVLVFLIVS